MMFRIRKSIDIDFAHHVRGHAGACINVHGHTWKFEVDVEAEALDPEGFVIDFAKLKREVLRPCHDLLDHGLAIGEATYDEVVHALSTLGRGLVESRRSIHGPDGCTPGPDEGRALELLGARLEWPGGIKVAVFPFAPTSERLAHWLYGLASARLDDTRVSVTAGRVYETLHPVEAVAEYLRPSRR
jgi:6-pyruvoyl tetrahydropterin synthase/QueD family protein